MAVMTKAANVRLILGEALDELRKLPDESVDSLVTDPPAGISFMGKSFDTDHGGRDAWVAVHAEIFRETKRVLKPGAHGLVWSLPRTQHWTATALEDAGFELRGSGIHLFSRGFPKSLDVSKAIDKAAGATREVVGRNPNYRDAAANAEHHERWNGAVMSAEVTAPATAAAKQWEGFGTALAPSHEEWILVRRPINQTVVANVLQFGTGALNIDASRIGMSKEVPASPPSRVAHGPSMGASRDPGTGGGFNPNIGRWPKDTLLSHSPECVVVGETRVKVAAPASGPTREAGAGGTTMGVFAGTGEGVTGADRRDADGKEAVEVWACPPHCAVRQLDDSVGSRKSGAMKAGTKRKKSKGLGGYGGGFPDEANRGEILPSSGFVSRFFYTGKVPPRERLLPDGTKSAHPTQKSVELMTYLTRMVTPPAGTILDPFLGSGTTGVAALAGGFGFIGIERDPQYMAWARARLGLGPAVAAAPATDDETVDLDEPTDAPTDESNDDDVIEL